MNSEANGSKASLALFLCTLQSSDCLCTFLFDGVLYWQDFTRILDKVFSDGSAEGAKQGAKSTAG